MQTYLDCIPCFTRQALDALRQITDDEDLMLRALRGVLRASADFGMELSPPEMAQIIHRIIREESGHSDPYAQIKQRSNQAATKLLPEARRWVEGAVDPFRMAVRFAIAGNSMDFALTSKWEQLDIENLLETAARKSLSEDDLEAFRKEVKAAKTILVLGDNAGEIVFDRLLMEQFGDATLYYAVKGSPVINDVTREDARFIKMEALAEVVDTGCDAPGTPLSQCTPQFLKLFSEVDLVVAKGQANYETLSDAPRSVFFLTQVKCPVIGRDLGTSVGSWVVQKHQPEVSGV